jgi:hypothetical protein
MNLMKKLLLTLSLTLLFSPMAIAQDALDGMFNTIAEFDTYSQRPFIEVRNQLIEDGFKEIRLNNSAVLNLMFSPSMRDDLGNLIESHGGELHIFDLVQSDATGSLTMHIFVYADQNDIVTSLAFQMPFDITPILEEYAEDELAIGMVIASLTSALEQYLGTSLENSHPDESVWAIDDEAKSYLRFALMLNQDPIYLALAVWYID